MFVLFLLLGCWAGCDITKQEIVLIQCTCSTHNLGQNLANSKFAGGPQEADIGAAGHREGGRAAEVGAGLGEDGGQVGGGGGQVEADRGAPREGEGDQRPRHHAQVITTGCSVWSDR